MINTLEKTIETLLEHGAKHILLTGPLGAGKTTLVKKRVEQLGIDSSTVNSPTYTYMNSYDQKILHIDMRRIESEEQLHELGILDAIDNHDYIVVERPKRIDSYADSTWTSISITKNDDDTRTYLLDTSIDKETL